MADKVTPKKSPKEEKPVNSKQGRLSVLNLIRAVKAEQPEHFNKPKVVVMNKT